jgi:hypothetical protein
MKTNNIRYEQSNQQPAMYLLIRFSFLLIFSLQSFASSGQSSPVLLWKVSEAKDMKDNELYAIACVFETSNQAVVWLQKNGQERFDFVVTSTIGEWADGKITYNLSDDVGTGKLVAELKNGKITLLLDLSITDPNGIRHTFFVDEVTTKP